MSNFTQGLVSEASLLSSVLDNSRSIGKLSNMKKKLINLNASLSALRTVLAARPQPLVSTSDALKNLEVSSFQLY